MNIKRDFILAIAGLLAGLLTGGAAARGQEMQWVEGFDQVKFHHNANRSALSRDFRGMARGFMTAGWWAPGQMKKNMVSWTTAPPLAKQSTTFVFVGASSVLPSEFTRGPQAKLSVNGRHALTFSLGYPRDFIWREGGYQLTYRSKRVEYPYFGAHRQLELTGNSGRFELKVPADAIEAGEPALIEVELQPFDGWANGWFMVKERRDALQDTLETQQGEIDALRQDMATLNQQTHMLATQVYRDQVDPHEFKHQVIYANGYRHLHPADLIKLQNGELLMMTREATEHYANDGDVILVRSKDGGQTWGDRQVIAGTKGLDEREGCGVQLRDGTIVVGIFYNNLYNADGTYNFEWKKLMEETNSDTKREANSTTGQRFLGSYVITSKDNGRSWSEPHFINSHGMPFTDLEGPTDAPIEMPDGSILMALTGKNLLSKLNGASAVMVRSTDHGQTWSHWSTIAADPALKLGGFMEPGIVVTKTGRIVAALRNHGPDHAIYATWSDDDGRTWAPALKTPMHGHPADLIQLSDGRIMASYGIRTPHSKPGGIRVCFSHDNGETWDLQSEIQIRRDFVNWDIGYPDSIELPDGRVLTAYYYNVFNKYFIGGTTWRP